MSDINKIITQSISYGIYFISGIILLITILIFYKSKKFFSNSKNSTIYSLVNENIKKISNFGFLLFSIASFVNLYIYFNRKLSIDISSTLLCVSLSCFWFFLGNLSYKISDQGIFLISRLYLWNTINSYEFHQGVLIIKTKKKRIKINPNINNLSHIIKLLEQNSIPNKSKLN